MVTMGTDSNTGLKFLAAMLFILFVDVSGWYFSRVNLQLSTAFTYYGVFLHKGHFQHFLSNATHRIFKFLGHVTETCVGSIECQNVPLV